MNMAALSSLPWKKMRSDIVARNNERFVTAFSTHWIKYVFPTFSYIVSLTLILTGLSLCPAITSMSRPAGWAFFVLLTFLLSVIHHWYFHRILSEGMIDVIMTNKRLIFLEDVLWFKDDMGEVDLIRIKAVEAHKDGFLENLFQYGTLWFDTGGSDIKSGRTIRLVPHPHRKAKMIEEILQLKS